MWYSALEVARYIITRCSELGRPVSNLKLQKMLYFIWIDFFRTTGRMLFSDDICAWHLGPVVPEVYYEYCSHASRPIYEEYNSGINQQDQQVLNGLINEYITVPANVLVARTHESGTPWDMVYKDGIGNRKVIPFSLIIDEEVR